MIQPFQQDYIIGQRFISGITPNFIIAQLTELPLINKHLKKNSQKIQQRFIDVISRMPSESDCPGYIYGFRNRSSYNSKDVKYEIKMGRTKRQVPQERIFQWEKADAHEYVQIFTIRSQRNKKLEALVHLVFAYARKTLIINGNRRVEWFQFSQKVATAAITNLLNLFMQRIHEKNMDKLEQIQEVPNYTFYNDLIQNLTARCKIHKEDSGFVAFGLPKTGKSLFRSIIADQQINVVSQKNKLKLVTGKNKLKETLYIQISTIEQHNDNLKQLEYYFIKWFELCHSHLFPLLVVKQSDIQSSSLVGVSQALSLLQKYIKLNDTMVIVVTKSKKNYGKQNILEAIAQNQNFINKKYFSLLKNSDYIVIKEPEKEGTFLSKDQISNIKNKVVNLFAKREKWAQLQLRIENNVLNLCYQIIQKSYETLPESFVQSFQKTILQYIEEEDQVEFLKNIYKLLEELKKPENQSQLQIFAIINKLLNALGLIEKTKIQCFLYVFCELCSNKTIINSTIFEKLNYKVNQKIATITQEWNLRLAQTIQNFRLSVLIYVENGNKDSQLLLKQIKESDNLQEIKKVLAKIQALEKASEKQQTKNLLKSIVYLSQHIKEVERYTAMGLNFNSMKGRIKEAVYFGLKKEEDKEKKEIIDLQLSKEFEEIEEVSTSITKASSNSQMTQQIYSFIKMSELIKKMKEHKDGITIHNFAQQFSFDVPPKISLKYNLLIFAKSIKFTNKTEFSFSGVLSENKEKKKLKLLIVSEQFQNAQKLTIPYKSPNGDGYALYIEQENITCMHPQNKKMAQGQQALLYIKKVYRQKFK